MENVSRLAGRGKIRQDHPIIPVHPITGGQEQNQALLHEDWSVENIYEKLGPALGRMAPPINPIFLGGPYWSLWS